MVNLSGYFQRIRQLMLLASDVDKSLLIEIYL